MASLALPASAALRPIVVLLLSAGFVACGSSKAVPHSPNTLPPDTDVADRNVSGASDIALPPKAGDSNVGQRCHTSFDCVGSTCVAVSLHEAVCLPGYASVSDVTLPQTRPAPPVGMLTSDVLWLSIPEEERP